MLRSLRRILHGASSIVGPVDNGRLVSFHSRMSKWQVASERMVLALSHGAPQRNLSSATKSLSHHTAWGRQWSLHSKGTPGAHVHFWTGGPAASGRWSIKSTRRSVSTMPPENIVYSIMFVNFGVFMAWQQPSLRQFMAHHFITSYSHLRAGYVHTLLTHAVSHKDTMHIFSNMFTFYFFGSSLGGVIGSARLLQLYAASAITGGLAQSFVDKRSAGLGASAAVNAIVIFSVLLNPTATYLLYGIVPLPAWALGVGWLAYDGMGAYKGGSNVAYLAHLGGAAVGVAGFAALTSGLW